MKNTPRTVLVVATILSLRLSASAIGQESNPTTGTQNARESRMDKETLRGKRFQFSWKSKEGGGTNGIARLKEDGTIQGIASPNEAAWLVDASGRLLFQHADGRISTKFDKAWSEQGVLYLEGPFLFREGIMHHLMEITGARSETGHRILAEEAARIKYSRQQFIYLDPGESCVVRLNDGASKQIRLVSVKEFRDPVIGLARRAEVQVELDGTVTNLICAPYVMPTETMGLRIQADTTSAWLDMPKRVQFSVWDARDAIVDTDRFGFPLPGYRLFSHGLQAYNEPVYLGDRDGDPAGQRFHHNYGVDLAGYEARQQVVSCIEGVVVQVNRREGDLAIRDDQGLILYYGHLDSILSGIRVGTPIKRGQWVAMLGRRGASGNFSHLHVGVFLSEAAMNAGQLNRGLNLYPWLVAAYQKKTSPALYAIASPHQTARTGERVVFDGRNSMADPGEITSFRWEFQDGTVVNGPCAEKVYEKPGCYMAALWVKDNRGMADVDFCKIKVFSRSTPEKVIPTLFVTYKPSEQVRVHQPVNFRLWPQGTEVENIQIDFGDGGVLRNYRPYSAITHKFTTSGLHIVAITGTAGKLPVTQKMKVLVQD